VRRLLGAAAVALLATACGTTVPLSAQGLAEGDGLQGSGNSQAQQGTGLPTSPLGTTRTSTGALTTGGSRGPVSAATTPPVTGVAPSVASSGPVKVGVLYVEGADQVASALGVSGLTTGDAKAQGKAVIDWVNEHGGMAGRRVLASYSAVSAQDAVNNPQLAQEAACRKLTEDDKVGFVVSYVNLLPATMACFAKGHASVIDDQSLLTEDVQQKYQSLFAAPGDFSAGRLIRELVDALWRTGWLTSASKVGAYHWDHPEMSRVVKTDLVPALARHGLKLTAEEAVSDGADGVSQNSGVAVRFRAAGVDRVIPVLASPLFLMQAASSQRYHPRFGMYSSFGPGALLETAAPKDELVGSAGIGWSPYLDIAGGKKPGPVSANETLCFDVLDKAGQKSSSATTKGLELNLCSVILYLKFAADRLHGVPGDLVMAARRAVGSSFRPADTFRSDITHRADGAAAYRDLTFEQDCSCYQYTSPVRLTANG
jgi:hypothetical protein